ncbi:MAG: YabP/YqfC family sporulation protein [Erysipelotrichaceae bacterium]|nr:YabP/YqfC family sporulation protein [Erysipelotrichaceae bacterium]MDD6093364.1 YabP/YqfC family sporulation protein [bacterium]MDY3934507.1 YabP/YqfC family sporulation protein [Bacilli bacterium]
MKIIDKLDRYLNENEYKLILDNNRLNIVNYEEIIDFSLSNIKVKLKDKIVSIEGRNLVINKMVDNEILITGNISNISIK